MADSLFSLISSEGKRENLCPVIPKQDFKAYNALQVQPYRTHRGLSLPVAEKSCGGGHFFGLCKKDISIPCPSYAMGKEKK
jgi:hypothetical protein